MISRLNKNKMVPVETRAPFLLESGQILPTYIGSMEVMSMLSATVWLVFSSMLYSLRLADRGSFPKPLTAAEERHYLERASQGDIEARNILIERNLRLVAHIMKKG